MKSQRLSLLANSPPEDPPPLLAVTLLATYFSPIFYEHIILKIIGTGEIKFSLSISAVIWKMISCSESHHSPTSA